MSKQVQHRLKKKKSSDYWPIFSASFGCDYQDWRFFPSFQGKPTARNLSACPCCLTFDSWTFFFFLIHTPVLLYNTLICAASNNKGPKKSSLLVTLRATWWDSDQQITHPAMFPAFTLTRSWWPHMLRSIRQIGMFWKQRMCSPRTPWNYL